ncbi:MAG: fumarylacetoacetate hydrolase family protein [Desulfitobacterium hafniense]|nr:fumarylacetoacetate hydrolase family protein [Desulfitobacterium hafniense]
MNIKNIYCVGRNFVLHAQELNNTIPASPLLFLKPTHSLIIADGRDIVFPKTRGDIHYEVEFVVHIGRQYEQGINVDDLIDQMALGLDLTLRHVQSELKKKGYPWLQAKGFPHSAVLTTWSPFKGIEESIKYDFILEKNGQVTQQGNIKDMIFDLPTIVEFTANNFGLDQGDIIFTGTPAGVGPVADGDCFTLKWDGKQLGDCTIKLI